MSLGFEAEFHRGLLAEAGVRPKLVPVIDRVAGVEGAHLADASGATVLGIDLPYYLGKYPKLAGSWRHMFRTGFAHFGAPAVYFRTRCRPERSSGR